MLCQRYAVTEEEAEEEEEEVVVERLFWKKRAVAFFARFLIAVSNVVREST